MVAAFASHIGAYKYEKKIYIVMHLKAMELERSWQVYFAIDDICFILSDFPVMWFFNLCNTLYMFIPRKTFLIRSLEH